MTSRADVCVVACAEAWRGDGEIFASGMGTIPMLAARLARASFEPDLLVSDGEAFFVAEDLPLGVAAEVIEGWIPFRSVFDTLWAGRRHVMMGASQIDQQGNQNIACIGPWAHPKAQLLGVRGAPGNTANHATSYWIPNHSTRVFVNQVDMISGIGYRRAADVGGFVNDHHEIRRVVSNLGVFDFETPDHRMRLRSVHPDVTVDELVAATAFELVIPDDVPTSRLPTESELALLSDVLDPAGARQAEVKG
ncbi:MAG TPA: CoA-transferase [Acidimicrobiales bacterium]|nr:CoA-transferase [Acidimicrobiales bacterium]